MTPKNLSRSCSVVGAITLSALLLPLSAAHAAAPAPRVTASTADAFGRVADAVFTDRTAALLDRAPTARTALKATTAGIRVSGTLAHTESTALSSLRGTRSRLAALGEAYSAADTEVAVDRTRVTSGWPPPGSPRPPPSPTGRSAATNPPPRAFAPTTS